MLNGYGVPIILGILDVGQKEFDLRDNYKDLFISRSLGASLICPYKKR